MLSTDSDHSRARHRSLSLPHLHPNPNPKKRSRSRSLPPLSSSTASSSSHPSPDPNGCPSLSMPPPPATATSAAGRRIHILGVGAIGSLIAAHFRLPPNPANIIPPILPYSESNNTQQQPHGESSSSTSTSAPHPPPRRLPFFNPSPSPSSDSNLPSVRLLLRSPTFARSLLASWSDISKPPNERGRTSIRIERDGTIRRARGFEVEVVSRNKPNLRKGKGKGRWDDEVEEMEEMEESDDMESPMRARKMRIDKDFSLKNERLPEEENEEAIQLEEEALRARSKDQFKSTGRPAFSKGYILARRWRTWQENVYNFPFRSLERYRGSLGGLGKDEDWSLYGSIPSSSSSSYDRDEETFLKRNDPIEFLFVSTKSFSSLDAIKRVKDRLGSRSTVVLCQNGMGSLEQVIEKLWPESLTSNCNSKDSHGDTSKNEFFSSSSPSSASDGDGNDLGKGRPNFIIAHTSHGARKKHEEGHGKQFGQGAMGLYRRRTKELVDMDEKLLDDPKERGLHVVHTTKGENSRIFFGVIPNEKAVRELERYYSERRLKKGHGSASRSNAGVGSAKLGGQHEGEVETDLMALNPVLNPHANDVHPHLDTHIPLEALSPTEPSSFDPSYNSTPLPSPLASLRSAISNLLSLQNLHPIWLPLPTYQVRAFQKLAVNACINPLTAICECHNGALYGSSMAREVIRRVAKECELVLGRAVGDLPSEVGKEEKRIWARNKNEGLNSSMEDRKREWIEQNRLPASHPLSEDSIVTAVNKVLFATSSNISSTLFDYRAAVSKTYSNDPSQEPDTSYETSDHELAYINGYITALGEKYGIETNTVRSLHELVDLKIDLARNRKTRRTPEMMAAESVFSGLTRNPSKPSESWGSEATKVSKIINEILGPGKLLGNSAN